jgi:hypothetical protein
MLVIRHYLTYIALSLHVFGFFHANIINLVNGKLKVRKFHRRVYSFFVPAKSQCNYDIYGLTACVRCKPSHTMLGSNIVSSFSYHFPLAVRCFTQDPINTIIDPYLRIESSNRQWPISQSNQEGESDPSHLFISNSHVDDQGVPFNGRGKAF